MMSGHDRPSGRPASGWLSSSPLFAAGCRVHGAPRSRGVRRNPEHPRRTRSGWHQRAVWDDVRAFYAQREHAPAWIGDSAPSKRAKDALRVIGSAGEHGLLASDYDEQAIARLLGELSTSRSGSGHGRSPERLARVRRARDHGAARVSAGTWRSAARRPCRSIAAGSRAARRRTSRRACSTAIDGNLADVARGDPPRASRIRRAPEGARGHDGRPPARRLAESARRACSSATSSHRSVITLRQRLAATGELQADRQSRAPNAPRRTYDSAGRSRGPRLPGAPRAQGDGRRGRRDAGGDERAGRRAHPADRAQPRALALDAGRPRRAPSSSSTSRTSTSSRASTARP